jgi:hypothetical protein
MKETIQKFFDILTLKILFMILNIFFQCIRMILKNQTFNIMDLNELKKCE